MAKEDRFIGNTFCKANWEQLLGKYSDYLWIAELLRYLTVPLASSTLMCTVSITIGG